MKRVYMRSYLLKYKYELVFYFLDRIRKEKKNYHTKKGNGQTEQKKLKKLNQLWKKNDNLLLDKINTNLIQVWQHTNFKNKYYKRNAKNKKNHQRIIPGK